MFSFVIVAMVMVSLYSNRILINTGAHSKGDGPFILEKKPRVLHLDQWAAGRERQDTGLGLSI